MQPDMAVLLKALNQLWLVGAVLAAGSFPAIPLRVERGAEGVSDVEARFFPGGGGLAFAQLCQSDAEIHLFTDVGYERRRGSSR